MITMNPVHFHGRSLWDSSYFPRDEYDQRLRIVQLEMARLGLGTLIVFGHIDRYQDLCWLTEFYPTLAWSLVIVPAQGDMQLVPKMGGGRDIPAAKMRTWVQQVDNFKSLGKGLRETLAGRRDCGKVGVVALDQSLPASLYYEAMQVLSEYECIPADDLMAEIRRSPRRRNLSSMRQAARIVEAAANRLAAVHASGWSNAAAMVEADGVARRMGASDFRGLAVLDETGELAPVEEQTHFHSEPLIAYLAVNFLGDWADLGITIGGASLPLLEEAKSALRAMINGVRPGAKVEDLARLAADMLTPGHLHDALRYGLGNGIGLALFDDPTVEEGNSAILSENSVLTLRVRLSDGGAPGVLVSEMVRVMPNGGEKLLVPA